MTNEQFYDHVLHIIKKLDVDLAETFQRCAIPGTGINKIKEIVILSIEDEYRSVDAEDDLYASLSLSDVKWLERFECEFLNILYISRFNADQIKVPLAGLQSVRLMDITHV